MAFCPYCGQQLASSVVAKPDINATYKPVNNKPINTIDSGKSHSENVTFNMTVQDYNRNKYNAKAQRHRALILAVQRLCVG